MFAAGLKAAGHSVEFAAPLRPNPDTLLVLWNRYNEGHTLALAVEKAGGRVLVAENGYMGEHGTTPKFDVHPGGPQPHHYYALAEGWHNGRGPVRAGEQDRFERLGVELKPWRTDGEYLLICPNRAFGVGEQVMHPDWAERAAVRHAKFFKHPIRIRAHPGNNEPKKRPLAEDLKGARAVVVWSSSVAQHALAEGIPTFIEAPFQIVKEASGTWKFDEPLMLPDRRPHFQRMAWAQWTCAEIETGEPFRHILA